MGVSSSRVAREMLFSMFLRFVRCVEKLRIERRKRCGINGWKVRIVNARTSLTIIVIAHRIFFFVAPILFQ